MEVLLCQNPFNAQTSISYSVIETGRTKLSVLDVLGREVTVLVDATQSTGQYNAFFDASKLPSGVYVCILQSATQLRMIEMKLVK